MNLADSGKSIVMECKTTAVALRGLSCIRRVACNSQEVPVVADGALRLSLGQDVFDEVPRYMSESIFPMYCALGHCWLL